MKHSNLLHRQNLKTSDVKFIKISMRQIQGVFSFIRKLIRKGKTRRQNKALDKWRKKHLYDKHKSYNSFPGR